MKNQRILALNTDLRKSIYQRDNGVCQICGEPVEFCEFHIDHIIPISRGGADEINNIQVSHRWCNIAKGNALPGQARQRTNKPNNALNTGEKASQTFVLTPTEQALIEEKVREMEQKTGSANASAALRTIIREWAELVATKPTAIAQDANK